MQAPDFRENIALSAEEDDEFIRLTSVFERVEEHLADTSLLVRYYSS
ncbi:hypothetical protein [Corynebacterium guangdongense]|uniref:Uncharacterized protein n=1 Tax=Corynebacterium guangdongense TaxID=1783348 RepID=A0ABU1ZYJ5_9CORY|nr:hypothetical protein [Corynebacterium guangdongense]MDR7330009.1 hypothetical protein [Corynebacterium guangdongense]WJZ18567.1 hypothetical protein CGUA_10065 [Corynebacterium guangdongense]